MSRWCQELLVRNLFPRQDLEKTLTSQVAESHIDSIIKARHKTTGKMRGCKPSTTEFM